MRINEVKYPSEKAINESVQRGEITESLGRILKTHGADQWGPALTAEEFDAYEAKILAEAGVK